MVAQDASMQEQLAAIQTDLTACSEWLLSVSETSGFAVQADEIEVMLRGDKLVLSCPTTRGWQHWTILAWEKSGEKLIFQTARKLKLDAATLEFMPRVSIENLREETKAARLLKAHELAEIARQTFSNRANIERVSLSQSNQRSKPGTIARIRLMLPSGKTIAICGSIVEKSDAANLLSNSILWFAKIEERQRIGELWLVVENETGANLQKFHALLRDGWREKIKIFIRSDAETLDQKTLTLVEPLSPADLWLEKPKKLLRPSTIELSQTAQEIVKLAPAAIDVARSKHGETLRFNGLPFVRIRKMADAEQAWFGVDAKRKRELTENSLEEFALLLENLREHRQSEASDKRHALYRGAAEAWLESVLRRDVSRLDPNLILAPLHAQFRLSNKQGALDLLALRTDGRLVVIELKATTDREHIFQAVNYWRQIELYRRQNILQEAQLFDDLPILNAPPLVYLVAPLMSFHPDYSILANAIAPEIEIWRFDLNEDWRARIRVARRRDFTTQNDIQFL